MAANKPRPANDNEPDARALSTADITRIVNHVLEATRRDRGTDVDIAKRLANIEALLAELLERRQGKVRALIKNSRTRQQRLRAKMEATHRQPTAEQIALARRLLAR